MILPIIFKHPDSSQKDFHTRLLKDGWKMQVNPMHLTENDKPAVSTFDGPQTRLCISFQKDLSLVNLQVVDKVTLEEHALHFVLEKSPWEMLEWLKIVKTKMVIEDIPELIMGSTKPLQILHGHQNDKGTLTLFIKGW